MKERLRHWMSGRYGMDKFGQFINIAAMIVLILGILFSELLVSIAFAAVLYQNFRMFSRNTGARSRENLAFISMQRRLKARFQSAGQQTRQRKTHRFYRCPSCKQQLRVPKGKGQIRLTCPNCKTQFERKS